jgi:crotonobetainyl-CoA:carnitine CoA-transferase CaiB-like acyl-CoA transferase
LQQEKVMAGVLSGIRVLDLSWGIAGPMATMLLADNGAEVTKIEPPGGDPFRSDPHTRLGYKVWQRGKKSAMLDLKNAGDRTLFLALAGAADVLVESYAPGTTEKLGIDYATLNKLNPRLIYCSITGYGRDNEHSHRPAYDALVQARTGLMYEQRSWPEGAVRHMSGLPDPYSDLEIPQEWLQGAPRPGPLFVASFWPSLGSFFLASLGIAAALRARLVTGRGQWVETSLFEGALAGAAGVWQRVEKPDAPGFDTWIFTSKSPKGHFKAKDGRWLHNWVPNPRFLLQAAAGATLNATPDLTVQNDPDRFGTGPEELLVMSHYQPILAEAVAKFPAHEWVEAAATAGVTMQPVRSIEESLADPALLEDGCVTEMEDPELGTVRTVGNAFNMSRTQGRPGPAAVAPGSNTDEVKAEAAKIIAQAKAEAAASRTSSGDSAKHGGAKLGAPLEGVTVLDLGMAVAGPFGAQLLSDLGATVIKINGLYDIFWHRVNVAYSCNRGKKSLVLNLKDPRSMRIFRELVKKADVVQHNMRYDAAERLEIDYESLKAINPGLIYCHSRGFDRGPRALLPGNDQTGACLSGIQYEDGGMARPGQTGETGRPLWSFTSFGDTGNGFLSATAIIHALSHRHLTGEGQFVDTSIINAGLLNTSYAIATPQGGGFERPRIGGDQVGYSAGHRLYPTRDGWLCLVLVSQAHWDALFTVLSLTDLVTDARYATTQARHANDAALARVIAERLMGDSAANWFARLDKAGVPVEIVDAEFSRKLHENADYRKRQWVVSYPHPAVGRLDQIGLLVRFSATPGVIQGRPLVVGEHTREILSGMGYGEEELKTMEEQFAIGFPGMPRMPPRPAPGQAKTPKTGMASMVEKEGRK